MLLVSTFLISLVVPTLGQEPFELTILHTNDVHSRIEQTNKYSASCSEDDAEEDKCYGGVARRYTAIQSINLTFPNVILLDAGDQFQGTLWFSEYEGLAASYFMNLLGYDAMALGNHEFDNGVEGLAPFLLNTTFPVLSCNINASEDAFINGLFKPSTVLHVGGEMIGVVGYTTTETRFLVDVDGIKDVVFEDEIISIQHEVDKLTSDGVNKIIVIGHGGYRKDLYIAEYVVGVDLIVGGHSNTFLYFGKENSYPSNEAAEGPYPTVVQQENGANVLIVQAYAYGKYLGFLSMMFDSNGEATSWNGNPILLDSTIAQDSEIMALVNELSEPLEEIRRTILGETYVLLDGPRTCRVRECNLGNVVCDAVLESHFTGPSSPGDAWTDIALVMLNSGGMRVVTAQGQITMEQVLDTLPFRNTIIMVRISGQTILSALEYSVSQYDLIDAKGSFLQFSGFHVVYNLTKPSGSRVASVSIRCQNCTVPKYQELNEDMFYNVLINNFMYNGGDGYSMFKPNSIETRDFGNLLADAAAEYVRRHTPLYQGKEGRIYILESADSNNQGTVPESHTTTTWTPADNLSNAASTAPNIPPNNSHSAAVRLDRISRSILSTCVLLLTVVLTSL